MGTDRQLSIGIHLVSENRSSDDGIAKSIRNQRSIQSPSEHCQLLTPTMRIQLSKCKTAFIDRNIIVDVLAILFGIGSWIGVNSIFLQLPLLVLAAPEGWNLPSYLVVIIQLANIGPLLYTIIQKFSPKKIRDAYVIYVVLVIGTVAALLMSFLHERTAYVAGAERSLALFIIVFFLALIGCTSSVLFMPYMGRFREIYLVTYLIGEGLSGFLPSIVTLIQGVGGNDECLLTNSTDGPEYVLYTPPPRFDTKIFFIIVFIMMIFSSVAFVLLDRLKLSKKEYAAVVIKHGNDYSYEHHDKKEETDQSEGAKWPKESVKKLTIFNYRFLLILMGIVCMFGNGILPSIQSYSCLPYGNIAYHFTVTLSSIANPLACFLAVFLPHTSIRLISILSGLASLFASYTLATALLSPNPPFVGNVVGEIIVVISWTLLVGLISYIKLCITTVFRFQGGKSLVWVGAVSQTGSFLGAIVSFCTINYTNLFVSYQPC